MATKPDDRNDLPPRVTGYRVLRRIGAGSYGEVWLARDRENRFCALKIIHRSAFENDRPFEREYNGIRKFVPVSRRHGSQVAIGEVGRNDEEGFFYYAMELADHDGAPSQTSADPGSTPASSFDPQTYRPKTLKSVLAVAGRLPVSQCIDIGLALATALDHLHRHGLIHRDIKPSNVIFVNGVPKLADIGLVTDMEATISYVGTEGFLPPEGPGSPQADLYSLGKVLYEISTGRDRLEFPELPSMTEDASADGELLELNLVFLKACQNEPARRYQTARELSADLALLQAGKSLHRSRQLERRLEQGKKVSMAVIVVLLAAGAVYVAAEQRRVQRMREETRRQERDKEIAQQVARETRNQLAMVYAGNAAQAAERGDHYGALAWLSEAWSQQPPSALRDRFALRLERLGQSLPPVVFVAHDAQGMLDASFSGDGHWLATASPQGPVRKWSPASPLDPPMTLFETCRGKAVALNGDGSVVAIQDLDGRIHLWSDARTVPISLPAGEEVVAADFRLEDRRIATATLGGRVALWDTANARERFQADLGEGAAQVSLSPNGDRIAALGENGSLRVWDLSSGDVLAVDPWPSQVSSRMAWSPDNRRMALARKDRIEIWNVNLRQASTVRFQHEGTILSLAFSPDGQWLLTGCADGAAHLWDAVTGDRRLSLPMHDAGVGDVRFSPDGRLFATVSGDRWQLWSVSSGQAWAPPMILGEEIRAAAFTADGDRAVIVGFRGTARVVEVRPDRFAGAFTRHGEDEDEENGRSGEGDLRAEDWPWLARLWSGRAVDAEGRLSRLSATQWEETIARVDATERFGQPERDVIRWHEQTARACEAGEEWFSAWFHWDRLTRARRADESAAIRAEGAWAGHLSMRARADQRAVEGRRLPERSAEAGVRQIDLTRYYQSGFERTWFPTNVIAFGNDLSAMPSGLVTFGGVVFDARGVVQLAGAALENMGGGFPREIRDIPIRQTGRRLHFLHGLAGDALVGTRVGSYVVRYADGGEWEIRLVYGENIRDWWFRENQPELTTRAVIAWQGTNAASSQLGMAVRIYRTHWKNPEPERRIESLSFVSAMEKPAPFLIAVTVE